MTRSCDCKWPGENWTCPECYWAAPRPLTRSQAARNAEERRIARESDERYAAAMEKRLEPEPERCSTCCSEHPDEHPAIGVFGIADICSDPFHRSEIGADVGGSGLPAPTRGENGAAADVSTDPHFPHFQPASQDLLHYPDDLSPSNDFAEWYDAHRRGEAV